MKRIFITGMSGVGKSTVVALLRGPDAICVDLDESDMMLYRATDREPLIDTDRVRGLITQNPDKHIIITGCAVNQGELRDVMDHYILLTAVDEVMHTRILTRTNNDFGKDPETWQKILADKREVEPLLRKQADIVIDTDRDIEGVLDEIRRLL